MMATFGRTWNANHVGPVYALESRGTSPRIALPMSTPVTVAMAKPSNDLLLRVTHASDHVPEVVSPAPDPPVPRPRRRLRWWWQHELLDTSAQET